MPQEQLTHLKILLRSAPSLLRLTLDTFLTSREAMRLSPATLDWYARLLQPFLNFLAEDGIIPESPMRKVKMPRVDNRILPAFAPEDVKRLLAAYLSACR